MLNSLVVTAENRGVYGALVDQQYRERHRLFVQEMEWDVPNNGIQEMDQYDRVDTVYVLVEEFGRVVGYARLLRTDKKISFGRAEFTYLVNDAALGRLRGIPSSIAEAKDLPQSEYVWEMSRLEASNKLVLEALFSKSWEFLQSAGAHSTITFTRKSFALILNKWDYPTTVASDAVHYGGKPYCVLKTKIS